MDIALLGEIKRVGANFHYFFGATLRTPSSVISVKQASRPSQLAIFECGLHGLKLGFANSKHFSLLLWEKVVTK